MKDLVNIGICDDDAAARSELADLCRMYAARTKRQFRIQFFTSAAELLEQAAMSPGNPDLLLLDIEMETGMSGIELMEYLQLHRSSTLILFVTSHGELGPEAYGRNVCGFITKPVDEEAFFARLASTLQLLNDDDNIVYFQAERGYHRVYYSTGESELETGSLKELVSRLDPRLFVQCHKSYIINLQHVQRYSRPWKEITMDNNIVLPVSKRMLTSVKRAYAGYCASSFRKRWGC